MPAPSTATGHRDHVVLGMSAALGAFLAFTIMNVCAKLLAERHPVIEIAFYRNAVALVPFLVMAFGLGRRDMLRIRSKPRWVIARAVLGTVSLTMTFLAYKLMPMAETTAFLFTASLFIPFFGIVFLHERVGVYRWSAVAAGFIGVLIMLHPSGGVYAFGVAIALGAALLQAGMQTMLRHLGRYELPETVTFYFFLIGTFVSGLALPFIAVAPTLAEIPLLLGVGLSGAVAQFLLSTAFRNAPAAIVTVFNYSGIVWATIFGWLIWDEWPLPIVLIGAGIVIAANILIIWRESRVRSITGDRIRAKF